MREPHPHPFLSSTPGSPAADADALILGLATDGGVSFRAGAAEGPAGIRYFSESIESWSPRARRDLDQLRLVDIGDMTGSFRDVETHVDVVLDQAWAGGRRPLVASLGGDHAVTPPIVRAVARRSDRLALVGFDAHLDLRVDYPGDHACTYRRVTEAGVPCVVLGPRAGAREEWEDAPRTLAQVSTGLTLEPAALRELEGRDVYVTVDIDVLDPSVAPGTGNPEPGGPSFQELEAAIRQLAGLRVVAFDVVEVSPPLDPSGITQAAAAVLVREMLLRFGAPPAA